MAYSSFIHNKKALVFIYLLFGRFFFSLLNQMDFQYFHITFASMVLRLDYVSTNDTQNKNFRFKKLLRKAS